MIPVSHADLKSASRLLEWAAFHILSAQSRTAREADKARQMRRLSKKLQKKIDNEPKQ